MASKMFCGIRECFGLIGCSLLPRDHCEDFDTARAQCDASKAQKPVAWSWIRTKRTPLKYTSSVQSKLHNLNRIWGTAKYWFVKRLNCCCFTDKYRRLTRLHRKVKSKIEDDLNVIKIIKDLRDVKILVNNSN